MKDDLEHRFVWKEDKVDCPACAPYFTLGFQTYDDDDKFNEFLRSGSQFEHIETVESYFTKPRFTLWFLLIGTKYIQGGELYRCKTCNQNWAHSDAEYAWRGYFRPISVVKPKMDAA